MSETALTSVAADALAGSPPAAPQVAEPQAAESAESTAEPAASAASRRPDWFVARPKWLGVIALELVLLAAVPIALWRYVYIRHIYNFHVVSEGVLYRSGQMSDVGFGSAIRNNGIKTVVNLRWGYENPDFISGVSQKEACETAGARYVFLPIADVVEQELVSIKRPDGNFCTVPRCVAQFLEIMDDPANHPVLIHCSVGKHRTGILAAVYRMEYEGWDSDRAMQEMMACGFLLDDRVTYWPERTFVATYQARSAPSPNPKYAYPYLWNRVVSPDGKPIHTPFLGPKQQHAFNENEPGRLGKPK